MATEQRNRLANATSPYLLQHAHNPVAWYEWGEDAFAEARANNKPVLLSVGYSACHWCHVMAHESFEDAATAAIMNEHFVNIKVDREERPDIDSIYMTAVQAMTGSGGWPMTVFLTPDGTPFYGGTYFPPQDRYGMPSFQRVLLSVAEAYRTRRSELQQAGDELVSRMREAGDARLGEQAVTAALLDEAFGALQSQFDPTYGGFGGAPKFPQAMTLEFLLRYAARTGRPEALEMAERTMRGMAEGGMYDQIGGGFHRYSVDAQWLVPHFEKMLYDNALLARTYLEAYQLTGDVFYRRIVEETLDYLVREMRHPAGGFYSTQDADSLPNPGADHKEEGAYFVWTPAELRAVLGPDAMPFAQIYDVSDAGNFEGKNILHFHRSPDTVARVLGITQPQIADLVARSRETLRMARQKRPAPDTDTKILAAWNGMAIRAFAAAARALGRDDYLAVAIDGASFVLRELRRDDGVLLRAWKDGQPGATPGFLEDHALLADALLALYEATFDPQWLLAARDLANAIVAGFWDDALGGFYDTAAYHQALVVRPRDTGDNATPSGSSVAADVLTRLALLFDEPAYRAKAEQVLAGVAPFMQRYPSGFGRHLSVAEFMLGKPFEVVLVGAPAAPDTHALAAPLYTRFVPNKVVAFKQPGQPDPFPSPLLHGREQVGAHATAYVCQNYACRLPVTEPGALLDQLGLPAS